MCFKENGENKNEKNDDNNKRKKLKEKVEARQMRATGRRMRCFSDFLISVALQSVIMAGRMQKQ